MTHKTPRNLIIILAISIATCFGLQHVLTADSGSFQKPINQKTVLEEANPYARDLAVDEAVLKNKEKNKKRSSDANNLNDDLANTIYRLSFDPPLPNMREEINAFLGEETTITGSMNLTAGDGGTRDNPATAPNAGSPLHNNASSLS